MYSGYILAHAPTPTNTTIRFFDSNSLGIPELKMRATHIVRCAYAPQLVSAVVVIGQLALTMFAYEHGDVVPNSAHILRPSLPAT